MNWIESNMMDHSGFWQGTTREAVLTGDVTSGISIDPSASELLIGGWQGTEAWSTLGSAVGTGEETKVVKMGWVGTKRPWAVREYAGPESGKTFRPMGGAEGRNTRRDNSVHVWTRGGTNTTTSVCPDTEPAETGQKGSLSEATAGGMKTAKGHNTGFLWGSIWRWTPEWFWWVQRGSEERKLVVRQLWRVEESLLGVLDSSRREDTSNVSIWKKSLLHAAKISLPAPHRAAGKAGSDAGISSSRCGEQSWSVCKSAAPNWSLPESPSQSCPLISWSCSPSTELWLDRARSISAGSILVRSFCFNRLLFWFEQNPKADGRQFSRSKKVFNLLHKKNTK